MKIRATNKPAVASKVIAIAGNPNCGKSALFNLLTGIRQTTGNWPGVTVERKEGQLEVAGQPVTLVDLPGIYSFDSNSEDERIASQYLISGEADAVINVLDATNLERGLYMTVQLLEMRVPLIVVVNMMDVARQRGMDLDLAALSTNLGCPVVAMVAVSGEGLPQLRDLLKQVLDGSLEAGLGMIYSDLVEEVIVDIQQGLDDRPVRCHPHWLAAKLLEGDGQADAQVSEATRQRVAAGRELIRQRVGEEPDVHIADSRFGHAHMIFRQVNPGQGLVGQTHSDRIDRWVLSRWLGVPIFLLVMYLMFTFAVNVGGAFIDLFDGLAGALLVEGAGSLMQAAGWPEWLRVLLADGLGGGVQVVATFIPIITSLYLVMSWLEDSGYMARAAFVMDRFMRMIGLPGRAFVPLIVGFGCNVPAVMATRTLESERERKLTTLMTPFMSCGARLPVYVIFVAVFFQDNGQNLVFLLYLAGIAVAVLTGYLMRMSLLPGSGSNLLMELPAYHWPNLRGVLLRTWDRVRVFVRDAGMVIVSMVLVLNLLNSVGTDGTLGNQDSEHSLLSAIGRGATPLFHPMGIDQDNWPATVGIMTGVLAKEVVVGTLDALYTRLGGGSPADAESFVLSAALLDALATVPANLSAVLDRLGDPLGLSDASVGSLEEAAEAVDASVGMMGEMARRFDGQAGAFAYMLFILLYFPCVATMGAIIRENGRRWAMFVAVWTTVMGYSAATIFYQSARFGEHPLSSAGWIVGCLSLLGFLTFALRQRMRRREDMGLSAQANAA